jgi:hypothetical protein
MKNRVFGGLIVAVFAWQSAPGGSPLNVAKFHWFANLAAQSQLNQSI